MDTTDNSPAIVTADSAHGSPAATSDALETTPPVSYSRDAARAKIFAAKPNSRKLVFFGVPVEVRDPSIEDVLSFQSNEDRAYGMALMIVNYVYNAGTDERLFEDGDIPDILALPFSSDIRVLQEAINDLTGVVPSTDDKSQAAT